jgi:hypothetical protein
VPEQQVIVLFVLFTVESFEFPPLVPSLMGAACDDLVPDGKPTLTLALPTCAAFDCKVAVTLTGFVAGKEFGAVYKPAALIVPTVALPPCTPPTLHVTVAGVCDPGIPNAALNCCWPPSCTTTELGVMVNAAWGCAGVLEPPPPQPAKASTRKARETIMLLAANDDFIGDLSSGITWRPESSNLPMRDTAL